MELRNFCRGVISGGLIGDCYGYVYEDRPTVPFSIPSKLLEDSKTGVDRSVLIYTDDTQMGLATLRSLRANGKLIPEKLAREYTQDFFKDGAHRYYGGSVPRIFKELEDNKYENPFKYAAQQFNGTGSFGNGGAMRASPVAVYALNMPESDFEKLVVDVTRLTHTHPLAVCGALLQAFAIRELWAIVSEPHQKLISDQFVDRLFERLTRVTYTFVNFKDPSWASALSAYKERLQQVKSLLIQPKKPSVEEVVNSLGNDLRAINSVPTALYAFLRSLQPIEGISLTSIPLRCLVYAICLGGDTDTIGTMACSLAGGYAGLSPANDEADSPIPETLLARCERLPMVKDILDWLICHLTNR